MVSTRFDSWMFPPSTQAVWQTWHIKQACLFYLRTMMSSIIWQLFGQLVLAMCSVLTESARHTIIGSKTEHCAAIIVYKLFSALCICCHLLYMITVSSTRSQYSLKGMLCMFSKIKNARLRLWTRGSSGNWTQLDSLKDWCIPLANDEVSTWLSWHQCVQTYAFYSCACYEYHYSDGNE